MSTHTSQAIFTDGSFVRIIRSLNPGPGEPIIASIVWEHGDGTFPVEVIGAILDAWQRHADLHEEVFEQAMTLPGGRVICWMFRPQQPCTPCLRSGSSAIGEGLFDAPPTRPAPMTSEGCRDAIRRAITPEEFATTFASLPEASQKRLRKYLVEPPVRRTVKIIINRRKKP